MKSFNEWDVRRHYDLLQHEPDLGLTQLKALDGNNIIGIGLFDNEDDFVSECERYNGLGDLYVGVNPRSIRLMEDYGGLKNRMRTLFLDVVEAGAIDHVTGVAVPDAKGLSEAAQGFLGDASVLSDRDIFFPMDEPIPVPQGEYGQMEAQISRWFYGEGNPATVSLMQFSRVMGTELPKRGWRRRRARFRKFRPYILEGIAADITGKGNDGR